MDFTKSQDFTGYRADRCPQDHLPGGSGLRGAHSPREWLTILRKVGGAPVILLFVSFFLSSGISEAQKADSLISGYTVINGPYLKSYVTDTRSFVKSPLQWKTKQWLTMCAVAGAGVLLYSKDPEIRDFVREHHTAAGGDFFRYGFEPWGSGLYPVPLLGCMYLTGRLAHNDRISATALTAGKAALISALFVNITKQLMHRHRPYQDNPANYAGWHGPFSDWRYASFPSGHSAFAFSIAAVLASEYRETGWVPVAAYAVAAGTAFSRIYRDKHWASDVFAGSALGIVTGRFLWKKNRAVRISPVLSAHYSMISVEVPLGCRHSRGDARCE